ncbi:ScbR family autoregulator-binding transcription factor [Mycobacterium sp. URHB0044]|jgi:AcrR family transcriptional regulator|uniref:ScbR family autoregulator-binding transcription factor n=1 Tax=Mycobacterium sp. URHB0044 TaxID=1380386 RepID=UPI0004912EA0|nr:ScbR family autoregulator-binding transcription factor [Mycobacterium sp. URHB0044]
MVRQSRSEATRRMIINAAVDLFSEMGYPSTGMGDVIERVAVTKGALYHHFRSKESLALAIIDEYLSAQRRAFWRPNDASPALESMIQGVIVGAEGAMTDKLIRTGADLLHTLAKFNDQAADYYRKWIAEVAARVRQAQVDGDVRADVDPEVVGEFIVSALVGVELIWSSTSGSPDLVQRVGQAWELLLPAIATESSLPYFREFLARQSQRHTHAKRVSE